MAWRGRFGLVVLGLAVWAVQCHGPQPTPQPALAPAATTGAQGLLQAVWTGQSYAYVLWPQQGVATAPVLIDAGSDPAALALQKTLAQGGVALDAVDTVLLTHGHLHHTAGLVRLPRAAVYVSFSDAALAQGDVAPGNWWLRLRQRLHKRIRHRRALRPLVAGQHLALAGHDIAVVALPGHTPGSLGFAVLGGLVAGDAVDAARSQRSMLRPSPPWACEAPRLATEVLGRVDAASLTFIADGHSGINGLQ